MGNKSSQRSRRLDTSCKLLLTVRDGADIQNAGYGLKWDEKEKEKKV